MYVFGSAACIDLKKQKTKSIYPEGSLEETSNKLESC